MLYKNRVKIGLIFLGMLSVVSVLLTFKDINTIFTEQYAESLKYVNNAGEPFDDYIDILESFTGTTSEYIDLLEEDSQLVATLEYTGNSMTTNSNVIYFEFKDLNTNELLNIEYSGFGRNDIATNTLFLPKQGNTYVMFLTECVYETVSKVDNCYGTANSSIDLGDSSIYVTSQLRVFDITTGFNSVDLTDSNPLALMTLKDIRDNGYTFMYGYEMKATGITRDTYYSSYQAIYDLVTARYSV